MRRANYNKTPVSIKNFVPKSAFESLQAERKLIIIPNKQQPQELHNGHRRGCHVS